MMRVRTFFLAALAALMLCAADRPAQAQKSRTLAIRDGKVFVDGRQVPPQSLPAAIDLDGIDAQYTFSGDLKPVIELGGRFYALEDEALQPVDVPPPLSAGGLFRRTPVPVASVPPSSLSVPGALHDGPLSRWTLSFEDVPFRDARFGEPGFEALQADAASFFAGRGFQLRAPEVVFMQQQARELAEQAGGLQELRDRLSAQGELAYVHQIDRHASRLRAQAEQTARMAHELPLFEMERYLSDVEHENRALFERLVHERDMEAETLHLAREIGSLPAGAARDRQTEELRTLLHEIFELKQDNRRREVARLERQLTGLQSRLAERERLRDQIIEQRLNELIEANAP